MTEQSLGEQIDLELALNLGQMHKRDRNYHHALKRSGCTGSMRVVKVDGAQAKSVCSTCGLSVTTTLNDCKVSWNG